MIFWGLNKDRCESSLLVVPVSLGDRTRANVLKKGTKGTNSLHSHWSLVGSSHPYLLCFIKLFSMCFALFNCAFSALWPVLYLVHYKTSQSKQLFITMLIFIFLSDHWNTIIYYCSESLFFTKFYFMWRNLYSSKLWCLSDTDKSKWEH